MEMYFNGVTTTLTTNIDDLDVPAVFEVTGDTLPPDPNYVIKIDNELLRVTAVDTSGSPYIYTADRAIDGTLAADHTVGASVTNILSEGALTLILDEQNHYLETADLATLAREGRTQHTDQKSFVERAGLFEHHFVDRIKVIPPDLGDYTIYNTDDLTQTTVNDALRVRRVSPTTTGHTLFNVPVGTIGGSGFTVGFQLNCCATAGEAAAFGVGVYDSGSDKHVVAMHGIKEASPTIFNKIEKWNGGTLDSTPLSPIAAYPNSIIFLRVEYDGTDINFFYSYDNNYFHPLGTTPVSFLTVDNFCFAIARYAIATLFHAGA